MEKKAINDLTLFFDSDEQEAAELIGDACKQSITILHGWGLDTPRDCRVYVMTSWSRFLFHSAPWPWRIYLIMTYPFRYISASRLWRYAGGWAVHYGKRQAIGVKPPHLLQLADGSIGERLFIKEDNFTERVRRNTCHELAHAFTAHLRLPAWLHEGFAMLAVDRLAGKPTVQAATLETLEHWPQEDSAAGSRRISVKDADTVITQCARGYWFMRYLDDTRPDLLRSLLSQRYDQHALEDKIAAGFGMEREALWGEISSVLVSHFKPGKTV